MTFLIQTAAAFVAIAAFSIYIEAPKKHLIWCGILGAAGWLIYLLCRDIGIIWATFISTLAITLISHIFARALKGPVTVFLIPGILPLVPGAYLYRTVYEFFFGTREQMSLNFILTIEVAGAIALAIFIMDSVFVMLKRITDKKNSAAASAFNQKK